MALVQYSDSEGSDAEDRPSVDTRHEKPPQKPTNKGKPAFQKLIDRSNPQKIKVSLGHGNGPDDRDEEEEEPERPGKRLRLNGMGGGGFNAMLPAPMKAAPAAAVDSKPRQRGLPGGISLKTGAAPGFSREPVAEPHPLPDDKDSSALGVPVEVESNETNGARGANPPPQPAASETLEEPKKFGNPMIFKPLSVARKLQKKKPKPETTKSTETLKPSANGKDVEQPKAPPKISLFSMGDSDVTNGQETPASSQNDYQPFFTQQNSQDEIQEPPQGLVGEETTERILETAASGPSQAQSLTSLASSLNLTPSQRRQLLGRNAGTKDVSVVNFNADAEYNANEEFRTATAGDSRQQAPNPVRAIAPGKHSLKQLVNAVAGQREALEESFATGKRNRKEAGSKYGW